MIGLSEMKAKSLRLMVNGRGTMRARKTAISNTKRRKTYPGIGVSFRIWLIGTLERNGEAVWRAVRLSQLGCSRPQLIRPESNSSEGNQSDNELNIQGCSRESFCRRFFESLELQGQKFVPVKRGGEFDSRASIQAGSSVNKHVPVGFIGAVEW